MTVCPIAIVASCKKCPAFGICPLKTVLGDHNPEAERAAASKPAASKGKKAAAK